MRVRYGSVADKFRPISAIGSYWAASGDAAALHVRSCRYRSFDPPKLPFLAGSPRPVADAHSSKRAPLLEDHLGSMPLGAELGSEVQEIPCIDIKTGLRGRIYLDIRPILQGSWNKPGFEAY